LARQVERYIDLDNTRQAAGRAKHIAISESDARSAFYEENVPAGFSALSLP
jgi:hypothetical protein